MSPNRTTKWIVYKSGTSEVLSAVEAGSVNQTLSGALASLLLPCNLMYNERENIFCILYMFVMCVLLFCILAVFVYLSDFATYCVF